MAAHRRHAASKHMKYVRESFETYDYDTMANGTVSIYRNGRFVAGGYVSYADAEQQALQWAELHWVLFTQYERTRDNGHRN